MDSNDEKIIAINAGSNTDDLIMNTNETNDFQNECTIENGHSSGDISMEIQEEIVPNLINNGIEKSVKISDKFTVENTCEEQSLNTTEVKNDPEQGSSSSDNTNFIPVSSEANVIEMLEETAKNNLSFLESEIKNDTTHFKKPRAVGALKTTQANKSSNKSNSKSKPNKTDPVIVSGALSQLLDYGMSDSEDSESDSVSISDTSDTNSELSDEIVVTKPAVTEPSNRNQERFRGNESSSDSSTYYDSDSSSDSGGDGACAITPVTNNKQKPAPPKMSSTVTKGELTLDDLPPIEQLQITVPEQDCVQIGVVSSIVEQLVIVQSLPGMPAYDIDTLLFLDRGGKPLGRIFDVLGPVTEPFYAVRFNSYEQAMEAGVKPGTPVFCAPYNAQHTAYVFVSELLKMKGSDASWKHNNEPPDVFLDYSDDEQEAAARRLRAGKSPVTNPTKSNSLERNKKFERQMNNKNILMNERFNPPSTSRRPQAEPERKNYQQIPNTPQNWSVPQAPRAIQRPEFCMPYQYGYFNQYGNFPVMPQFGMPPMVGPNVFHAPQPYNPHVPPPIMRPQPVSYFPNPRHARWAPPSNVGNGVIPTPHSNFGNGPVNQ